MNQEQPLRSSRPHASEASLPLRRAAALGLFAAAVGYSTTFVEAGALDDLLNRTTVPGSAAFVDVPVTIALIVLTVIVASTRRFPQQRLLFLVEASAIWLGHGAGWSIGHGSVTGDLMLLVFIAIVSSAVAAWLLSRKGRKEAKLSPV